MGETGAVPPLAGDVLTRFLLLLVVLLVLARLLGGLAARMGLPAIAGELLTGVLLGPSLLGWIAPGVAELLVPADHAGLHVVLYLVDAVGQVGLLLLVALTATHIDMTYVRRRSRAAVAVSLGGLLVPLAGGIGIGVALAGVLAPSGPGTSPSARAVFPLFLGVALCVSAIPVIAKTLSDMGLLHRDVGQLTLAAGMVDDAIGWLLLAVVAAAATTGVLAGQVAVSVAAMLGFVLLAVLVGRPVVRWLMRRAARHSPGSAGAAAVAVVLGGGLVTQALHLEAIVGAFVAGILVATAGGDVQRALAPLRTVTLSVLAPIFLATAGLRMDLTALAEPGVLVAALLVLAVAVSGKFAGAYLGARLSRLSRWEGFALGAGMNARGVVQVIVALTGLRLGVLDTAGYTVIVLVALVTSLIAPPLLRAATNRIATNDGERRRAAEHAHWNGAARDGA